MKTYNFSMDQAGEERKLQLSELDEIYLEAYENAKFYKEKSKKFHDSMIIKKDFMVGTQWSDIRKCKFTYFSLHCDFLAFIKFRKSL